MRLGASLSQKMRDSVTWTTGRLASKDLAFRHDRVQQVLEPDAPEHFSSYTIRHAVDDFGSVLGRIYMHAKRSLAERCVNHPDDGFGHRTRVGIRRLEARETLEGRLGNFLVGSLVVLGGARRVGRRTGVNASAGPNDM